MKIVELLGPMSGGYYELHVEGEPVPRIQVYETSAGYSLTLDGRFGFDTTIDELERWGWFLANAMAVAGGYSCFGPHRRRVDMFGVVV